MKLIVIIGAVVVVLAILVGVLALMALLWMICWNAVVPVVFSGAVITFWQALGMVVLLNMIGSAFGLRSRQARYE